MKTLASILDYIRHNPDAKVVILDIDDTIMATSRDGRESIINEAQLAKALAGKIICFATDKANDIPKVLIEFIEKYDLLFAPELYGRAAKLRGVFSQERNSIVELPLRDFIKAQDFSSQAFCVAIARAYSLYKGESIAQVSMINLEDVDNLCLRLLLLCIQNDISTDMIDQLLSQYHDYIQAQPNLDILKAEAGLLPRISKQLHAALGQMIHQGDLANAKKLFGLYQKFIANQGLLYQGHESLSYLAAIHPLNLAEAIAYLESKDYGVAEQENIQTFLLYRICLTDISDIHNDLLRLFEWIVARIIKQESDPSKCIAITFNDLAVMDKNLQAIKKLLPEDHSIHHMCMDSFCSDLLHMQPDSSGSATDKIPLIFNEEQVSRYYQSLGVEKPTQKTFCERVYPFLLNQASDTLASSSVFATSEASTSQAIPTPESITSAVDRQISQLHVNVNIISLRDDGAISCEISLLDREGGKLIFGTTFATLAAYNQFFTQKQPAFLYLMQTLNVLPNEIDGDFNFHYRVEDRAFQTRDIYFVDDSQLFCHCAREVGITHVIHADTPQAMHECQKFLGLLWQSMSELDVTKSFDVEALAALLPEASKVHLDPLKDMFTHARWEEAKQYINQLIRMRLHAQDSSLQQNLIDILNLAAEQVRDYVNIYDLLKDVHRNLPSPLLTKYNALKSAMSTQNWMSAGQEIIQLRALVQLYPGNTYIEALGGERLASRIDLNTAINIVHSREFSENSVAYQMAEAKLNLPLSLALNVRHEASSTLTDIIPGFEHICSEITKGYQYFQATKQAVLKLQKRNLPVIDTLSGLLLTHNSSSAGLGFTNTQQLVEQLHGVELSGLRKIGRSSQLLDNVKNNYNELITIENKLLQVLMRDLPFDKRTPSARDLTISLAIFTYMETLQAYMQSKSNNPRFIPKLSLAKPADIMVIFNDKKIQGVVSKLIDTWVTCVATDAISQEHARLIITERLVTLLFKQPLLGLQQDPSLWRQMVENPILTGTAASALLRSYPPSRPATEAFCSSSSEVSALPPVSSSSTQPHDSDARRASIAIYGLTSTSQTVFYAAPSTSSQESKSSATNEHHAPK